jgi:hypothetical protein
LSCGLTIANWHEFPAAICLSNTAYLGFNAFAANAPAPNCVNGANTVLGVATFTATAQAGQVRFILPDDWVAGPGNDLEFRFRSSTAGGSGAVGWRVGIACAAAAGAGVDPAFGAPQTASATARANDLTNTATIQAFSAGGCSAGSMLFIQFSLDPSTTAAGNQELLSLRVRLKRRIAAL